MTTFAIKAKRKQIHPGKILNENFRVTLRLLHLIVLKEAKKGQFEELKPFLLRELA